MSVSNSPTPCSGSTTNRESGDRLAFRNVDASLDGPVQDWPYEALTTAIERGYLSHWVRIAAAIRRRPWGPVARSVEEYARYADDDGAVPLLLESIRRARQSAESAEREEVAARIRDAVGRSGPTADCFASEVGTSPARLSTYNSAKVMPSAAMLVRIERAAARMANTDRSFRVAMGHVDRIVVLALPRVTPADQAISIAPRAQPAPASSRSTESADSTVSMTMVAAPSTPARSPVEDVTTCRLWVASGAVRR